MEEVLSTPGSGLHSPSTCSDERVWARARTPKGESVNYLEVLGQGKEVNVIISCSLQLG